MRRLRPAQRHRHTCRSICQRCAPTWKVPPLNISCTARLRAWRAALLPVPGSIPLPPGVHHLVACGKRGETLPGVVFVQGFEILRLAVGFIQHAVINRLVGRLRKARLEIPRQTLHQWFGDGTGPKESAVPALLRQRRCPSINPQLMRIIRRFFALASHERDDTRLSGDFLRPASELQGEAIGEQSRFRVGMDGPGFLFRPVGEAVVL